MSILGLQLNEQLSFLSLEQINLPANFLFSLSILISKICSIMAFRHLSLAFAFGSSFMFLSSSWSETKTYKN